MEFRSSLAIPQDQRAELVELLNGLLANTMDLYTQAKHAHWNVKGRHFISAHELFDDVAKHLVSHSDDLAERVAALGGYARGTARLVVEQTALSEFSPDSYRGRDCLRALVAQLAAHGRALRAGIDRCGELDLASQDLLIGILREVEQDLWFLESHLEDPRKAQLEEEEEEQVPIQPS